MKRRGIKPEDFINGNGSDDFDDDEEGEDFDFGEDGEDDYDDEESEEAAQPAKRPKHWVQEWSGLTCYYLKWNIYLQKQEIKK